MLDKIRSAMKSNDINAVILTNNENVKASMNLFYATGFKGSSGGALITQEEAIFITDFRYASICDKQVKDFEIVIQSKGKGLYDELKDKVEELGLSKVYIDPYIFYSEVLLLEKKCPNVSFESFENLFFECRMVKTKEEISSIEKACKITDEAFKHLLSVIKVGMSEKELATILDRKLVDLGASGNSFSTIAVSGVNGALPHGVPSDKKIQEGELITFDFGCYYNKYSSDMTRTIAVGHVNDKLKEIYEVVKKAQEAGVNAVKAGVKASEIDKVCRDIITEAGYGEYFGHGTGHGIGVDVHEGPSVSWVSDHTLEVNNVITVEPGIYIPGVGGVRIEDDVVVTDDGCIVLNTTPKDLIII